MRSTSVASRIMVCDDSAPDPGVRIYLMSKSNDILNKRLIYCGKLLNEVKLKVAMRWNLTTQTRT